MGNLSTPIKALFFVSFLYLTACTKEQPVRTETITETVFDTIVVTEVDTVLVVEQDSLIRGPLRGYIYGLINRDMKNFKNVKPAVKDKISGFVLHLPWNIAQPIANGPIHADAKALLDEAEQLAMENGYDQIRLRFFAGIDSPDWAKALAGGPMIWEDPTDGGTFDVPVWFDNEFLDAYEDVISKLAEELSNRPLFKEITCSGASTVYAEPCIRQFSHQPNRAAALSNGYTIVNDTMAFKRAIDIHHQYMSPLGIVSSVAYNPYQYIDANGNLGSALKWEICKNLMDYQANTMQEYGIWDNHSLGVNVEGKQVRGLYYNQMYTHMALNAARNVPTTFQTMTYTKMQWPENLATPFNTIQYAIDNLALAVEMPSGWENSGPLEVSVEDCTALNNALKIRADYLNANPFKGQVGF